MNAVNLTAVGCRAAGLVCSAHAQSPRLYLMCVDDRFDGKQRCGGNLWDWEVFCFSYEKRPTATPFAFVGSIGEEFPRLVMRCCDFAGLSG